MWGIPSSRVDIEMAIYLEIDQGVSPGASFHSREQHFNGDIAFDSLLLPLVLPAGTRRTQLWGPANGLPTLS